MKTNFLKGFTLVVAIVVAFASCSSDDNNDNGGGSSDQFFCKVNGADYRPSFVSAFKGGITNTIIITGATGTNEQQVQFQLPGNIATGTYSEFNDISANVFVGAFYSPPTSQDAGDDGFAESGQLIITEHNVAAKRIKGTFSFVTRPSINAGTVWTISEGTFNVVYTDL